MLCQSICLPWLPWQRRVQLTLAFGCDFRQIEALITTAYDHVQKDDIARFWRWLSEIGEFARPQR